MISSGGGRSHAALAAANTSPRKRRRAIVAAVVTVVAAAGLAAAWLTIAWADGGAPPGGRGGAANADRAGGRPPARDGAVRLTPEQARALGVTTVAVEARPLAGEIHAAGVVVVDESRLVQMAPKFGGFAEQLHVGATGQAVRRGEPVLKVYSPELTTAQQELLVAAQLRREAGEDAGALPGVPPASRDLVAAARRRLQFLGVSDAQIAAVLRRGEPQRTITLGAPASGVIVEKHVAQGQAFTAGQTLYTIADLSTVWVEADLPESAAGAVPAGALAEVTLAALPGRQLSGRVEHLSPLLDSATHRVRARIALANPEQLLKPGMRASARLTTAERTALAVPTSAIVQAGDRRSLVLVDRGDGTLVPREIQTGQVAGDLTEVLAGLEPGQRVITPARALTDSTSPVAPALRGLIGRRP